MGLLAFALTPLKALKGQNITLSEVKLQAPKLDMSFNSSGAAYQVCDLIVSSSVNQG